MRPSLPLALLFAGSAPLAAQMLPAPPLEVVQTGRFRDPALRESSAVVASHRIPGVLFTVNDSGNPPEIFAFDSTGRVWGRWRVPGTRNRDWEAMSLGPCPAGSCLYIGDTGDDLERRDAAVIYRIREPTRLARFRGAPDPTPTDLDSAVVRYPDGPHDVEALWVDDRADVYLASKGRHDAVHVYRLPGTAFGTGRGATAELVQILRIGPDPDLGRMVTDASRSPDGRRVALRTYGALYIYQVADDGRLAEPTACNLAGLQPQGEGIAWLDDRRILLTSESPPGTGAAPILVVTCSG
ncbi:MAG TPA: hypothetical protein VNH46_06050 [Gemmatimonadales bacterium]|nr:hypothetical protein [Gemmatimonadales bacterium]